jgi:hypothetical protein
MAKRLSYHDWGMATDQVARLSLMRMRLPAATEASSRDQPIEGRHERWGLVRHGQDYCVILSFERLGST